MGGYGRIHCCEDGSHIPTLQNLVIAHDTLPLKNVGSLLLQNAVTKSILGSNPITTYNGNGYYLACPI